MNDGSRTKRGAPAEEAAGAPHHFNQSAAWLLPESKRGGRLVSGRGLDAVAAISGCGYRRPVAAAAGFRCPVNL